MKSLGSLQVRTLLGFSLTEALRAEANVRYPPLVGIHRLTPSLSALALAMLVSSTVAGQDDADADADAPVSTASLAPTYQGVVPGSGQTAPSAPAVGERLVLTWPGFQPRPDGASRFFVQTNGVVETTTARGRRPFRDRPSRTRRFAFGTTPRTLDTRFFNTPVDSARVERRRNDVAIVVRDGAATSRPQVTSESAANGYHFVFIEFPPGDYAVEGE